MNKQEAAQKLFSLNTSLDRMLREAFEKGWDAKEREVTPVVEGLEFYSRSYMEENWDQSEGLDVVRYHDGREAREILKEYRGKNFTSASSNNKKEASNNEETLRTLADPGIDPTRARGDLSPNRGDERRAAQEAPV